MATDTPRSAEYVATDYGFKWGAGEVTRIAEHKGYVCLAIQSESALVEVWISPTGRSTNVSVYERSGKIIDKKRAEGYWRTRHKVFDRWFPERPKKAKVAARIDGCQGSAKPDQSDGSDGDG